MLVLHCVCLRMCWLVCAGTRHIVCAVALVYIACLGKYLMSSNATDDRECKAVQSVRLGTGSEVGEISGIWQFLELMPNCDSMEVPKSNSRIAHSTIAKK